MLKISLKKLSIALLCAVPCSLASASDAPELNYGELSNALDTLAGNYFKPESPGCAVGVIHRGEYVHKAGYGMANLEHNIPINSQSVFRIGSVSKQFTAMAIALLAERGDIDLDADVHTYLPDLIDYGHTVTVGQMVYHLAGMGDYDAATFLKADGTHTRFGNQDYLTIDEFYQLVAKTPLIHEPDTKWQYSNLGYFLLAMVVEKVSGQTLREFAEQEIFGKLEMSATFFNDNVNGIVPNRVDGYVQLEDGSYELLMTNLNWVGDGGLYTNLDDFIAWDQNFYQNRLGQGKPSLIDSMITPHPKANAEITKLSGSLEKSYAFGLIVDSYRDEPRIMHGGSWVGFRAFYERFPQWQLSLVSFCNAPRTTLVEFCDKATDIYLDAVTNASDNRVGAGQ